MPFDPAQPANSSPLVSQVIRDNLMALFNLIQSIPAGPPGQQGIPGNDGAPGPQGPPFAQAIMDAVNTLNPGDAAQAAVSFDGTNVHFTFGIPRGNDGVSSPPVTSFIVDGVNTLNPSDPATVQSSFDGSSVHFVFGIPRGNNGNDGGTGPAGAGVNGVIVDAVNTLNPGDNAQAGVSFDGSNVRFTFGIPRGNDGSNGSTGPAGPGVNGVIVDAVNTLNPGDNAQAGVSFDGSNVRFTFGIPRGFNGNDGGQGSQGPPGEVSQSQLNSAIVGTSNNTNAVSTLDSPFVNDPPTLGDLEAMRAKVNELILNGRR